MRSSFSRSIYHLLMLGVMAGALILVRDAVAADKYTPDKDPVTLGNKALGESQGLGTADAKARFQEAVDNQWKVDEAKFGLGQVAVREGRYADAEALFKEALTLRKTTGQKTDFFPEAHAALGLLYMRLGRDAEAAQEVDKAVTQKGNYWPGLYAKARRMMDAGQMEQAEKILDKGESVTKAPKNGLAYGEDMYHHGMALYYLKTNDLDKAEKEGMTAFQMLPTENEYGTLVAEIYEKKGSPDMAIFAYEQALKQPGMEKSAALYRNLGLLYSKVQKYNEARDAYLKAVEIDSTYTPVLKDLAALLHLADQNDKAAAVYIRYLQSQPDDVDALVGLAESCLEINQIAKAQEAAQGAFSRDSTNVHARLALARVGLETRDTALRQQSLYLYATLPDSIRLTARDYARIGAIHADNKNYPKAQEYLDKAMALDPQEPEVHFQLGMVDMGTNKPDSAIVHLEKAVSLKPSELYLLNLGVAYLRAKQPDKARPAFRKAIAINPKFVPAHVLLGQALGASDSLYAAELEYRKALELDPKNGGALRGLGFLYQKQAKWAEAVQWYKQATDVEPQNAEGWGVLGYAYMGAKMNDPARQAFEKALSIDPGNQTAKKGLQGLMQMGVKAPAQAPKE
jgi:tetratricopeptide (TPR) repeat protein